MSLRNTSAFLGVLGVLSFVSVGCATKKHVREAIAPVQNQVNQTQAQLGTLAKANRRQQKADRPGHW